MLCFAILLLVSLALTVDPAEGYYGVSLTVTPGNSYPNGLVETHVHYRQSSRGDCVSDINWTCNPDCGTLMYTATEVTDLDKQNQWCQVETLMTTNVTSNSPFMLSATGCCWEENVNNDNQWNILSSIVTGLRSDTQSPNRAPVSAVIPNIRAPQNCFQSLHLLSHDPDGDVVNCLIENQNISFTEASCTLNRKGSLAVGLHVLNLILVDMPASDITLTYSGLTQIVKAFNQSDDMTKSFISFVPLQFGLEILPPVESCEPGVNSPRFLSPTPLHGEEHHAAVGHVYEIILRAENSGNSIVDFQISGPFNMSKTLMNESQEVAVATLTWTPQEKDLYRHVPLCFAAETLNSQSEMRCIVVIVAKSMVLSGEAEVSCGDNHISIVVRKSSLEGVDQSWLQLRDPTCSLTSNDTHILGTMSLNTCGTTVEDSGDYLVFKNEINSFENPNAVITRRNQVKIGFSCQYPKVAQVSTYYVNHKSDYIFTESSFGTFSYSFEIFTGNDFSSQVDPDLYPVQVKLMQMLYMGIEAHSALPDVRLFVESCRATPEDNPYSALHYDIIKDGCILDETVKVYPSNSTNYDFEIQAFKFTGGFDEVYITCSVILCANGSPNSRCAQGCLNNTSAKRRRDLNEETARHYITQGPLRVLRQTSAASENGGHLQISASTGVFAGLFIVTIVLLVGLFVYNIKKTRALDRIHLLSSF